jgi:hypothetical protein
LPKNARVEIYNLEGKRLRSNNPENLKILRIMVQTNIIVFAWQNSGSDNAFRARKPCISCKMHLTKIEN